MARFLLIHGAWHGAWCWEGVAADLRQAGHDVDAIDLPGHGEDTTPHEEVTLDLYAQRIAEALDDDGDPTILVGHSMGGIAVTQAAELRPEGIAKLVYVTAFLPKDGQSLKDLAELPENPDDTVMPNAEIVPPDAILPGPVSRNAFFTRTPGEITEMAISRLNPQPLPPLVTPVSITQERAGSVERHYIACTDDNAIPIALQRRMASESPCKTVVEIDTDHEPFFSARAELVEALKALA